MRIRSILGILCDLTYGFENGTALLAAAGKLECTAQELKVDVGFTRRPSLYLARSTKEIRAFEKEVRLRQRHGLDADLWVRNQISEHYSFSAPAGILTTSAAELDPSSFTHGLIRRARKMGLKVYSPITVLGFTSERNCVALELSNGMTLHARKVIVAGGYESMRFLNRKLVRLKSSYVLATQPRLSWNGWPDRALIWDSGRPYY